MIRFELLSRDNMGSYHAHRIVMSSSIVPRDVGDWSLGIGSDYPSGSWRWIILTARREPDV